MDILLLIVVDMRPTIVYKSYNVQQTITNTSQFTTDVRHCDYDFDDE